MKRVRTILWGTVFLAVGVIIGGNSIGVWNIDLFFDGWWTLFLIVPAFIDLFRDSSKGGDLFLIALGVVLLLACQDVLSFRLILKLIVPIALVIIGLAIIFRGAFGGKIAKEIKRLKKSKNAEEHSAVFTELSLNYDDQAFFGGDLSAVFGSISCDLSKAVLENNTVINVTTVFGGATVKVSDDTAVKIATTSIFGGASDDRKHTEALGGNTVYINATCIFGGVKIR